MAAVFASNLIWKDSSVLRILYVCAFYKPAYVYGGSIRSIVTMCEGLVKAGAEVTVFTTNANGANRLQVPLGQPMNVEGVTVCYFPLALNGLGMFYSPGLAAAISERVAEFDLVVAEAIWTHFLGPTALACTQAQIPYIIPARGQLYPAALNKSQVKKWLYLELYGRRYLNRAAAIYCTDSSEASAIAALRLRPPTFVLPNGIDLSTFRKLPERGHIRRHLGIPHEAAILLFLGRIHRNKRPGIAIEALAAAQSLQKPVHLIFAGPDEQNLTPSLLALAQHLGCADLVHFTGLLTGDDLLHVLVDADLLLSPVEVQENFGRAAAEALAAELPVLTSDAVPVGCWAEEAGVGRTSPCNSEAFGRATVELLSVPEKLRETGKRGRELVWKQFDISVVAQQMLVQYGAIIATGRPVPNAQ